MEAIEVKRAGGVEVGVFEGYASTWEPDEGGKAGVPDQFVYGAWSDSLAEHRARGNRPIRMRAEHGDQTIGGYPIELAREDSRGLYVVGHINLGTQLGREVWSSILLGHISDLSVGYAPLKDEIKPGVRRILKANLWEISPVSEPGNRGAKILAVRDAAGSTLSMAPAVETASASLSSLLAGIRAASADLRADRERAAPPSWSSARHSGGSLAGVLADLKTIGAELRRRRQREAIAASDAARDELRARLAGLETHLRVSA